MTECALLMPNDREPDSATGVGGGVTVTFDRLSGPDRKTILAQQMERAAEAAHSPMLPSGLRDRFLAYIEGPWAPPANQLPTKQSPEQHGNAKDGFRQPVLSNHDRDQRLRLKEKVLGAHSQVLGMDNRELAAIFTVQTAGEALNYHPHLHGLLADGYWKDGVFTRFLEIDLKAIEEAFAERALAQLHKRELISDDDVAQILSQDHTRFGVWLGDPFHDKESEQFVARYIERAPISLKKLSIQDDIVTYTTKDGAAHACLAVALA
jgi:hypothetical protein